MRSKNLSRLRRRRRNRAHQLIVSLGHPRLFLRLVKSRIDARIGHNSNVFFILYNDRAFIEFGFVRIILAILPPRAHPIAVWLRPPIRQSV